MKNRWSDADAAAFVRDLAPRHGELVAERVYTARLLGAEADLVLHGGGNTSVKRTWSDPLGEPVEAVCVKASGADLATIGPEGHVPLALAPLRRLRALPDLDDEAMSGELLRHRLQPADRAPSLEALAHAFLPARFVDHTHADAVLALSNRREGERWIREALGPEVTIVPYLHPGFALARAVARAHDANPAAEGMVWMRHGLLTWGESARASYERTIRLVTRAEEFLRARAGAGRSGTAARSAGPARAAASATPPSGEARRSEERLARLACVAPLVRGAISPPTGDADRPFRPIVVSALVSDEIAGLLEGDNAARFAATPPLTTDHLIRTKAFPLFLPDPPWDDEAALRGRLAEAVASYRNAYEAYLDRNRALLPAGMQPFDPMPRVVLLPGLGALCAGEDERRALIARDITEHTLRAKAASDGLGAFEGPSEAELFAMEYRSFQQAKLGEHTRLGDAAAPPLAGTSLPLRGTIALVTGAAGAIGSGICRVLAEAGVHVAATDLPGARLEAFGEELKAEFGGRAVAMALDVTDPASVGGAFDAVCRLWGGLDLLVVNAGLAVAGTLDALDAESLRKLQAVNVEGTLHLFQRARVLFASQRTGGDVVLVSTKNVFAPGAGFGAYSATKAAAHQLARIASLELAPLGVRVNMVAPDAVFGEGEHRSGLWAEVGPGRMKARGLDPAGLEEHYRQRNLLKARVTARHVGNAVLFFAARRTPTTGATIPVDGGLPDATPR